MPLQLLTTKLFIPSVRRGFVRRPRLTRRLSAGLDGSLTLVSAPAGFGKTTALAAWIAACRANDTSGRFCWLSLDQADNDPVRFWSHVIGALQTAEAGIGAAEQETLQSPRPLAAPAILPGLINQLALLPFRIILVLDDLHEIGSPAIHEGIVLLLDKLPPTLHLVVASRTDPPWPLARLRVRGQVNEVRIQDLRFTSDEAADLLTGVSGLSLTPEDIQSLGERTEGWAAGLQLAAVSLQGRDDSGAFVQAFSGSNRFVIDYLAEEVLLRQDAATQEFLLKTSVLGRMNAPLCSAVLGSDGPGIAAASQRLEYLERANLFVVPLDDQRGWYRYHHLFADLLRAQLAQRLPGLIPELHLRASVWLEGAGLLDEAIGHALAAADMERAACLVEQIALHMFVEQRPAALSRWMEALPADVMRARPWLCLYHAWTHHWMGLRAEVEEWLRAAEAALHSLPAAGASPESGAVARGVPGLTQAERNSLLGHIGAIRAQNLLTDGDLQGVIDLAPRALALLSDGEYVRTTMGVALGGALWGLGDVRGSQQAFEAANANALKGGYRHWSIPSACYVSMQQIKQGLLHEAFETCRRARDLAADAAGRELPAAGFPNIRMGDLLREWNDLPAAEGLLTAGVRQCEQVGQADVLVDAYVALARLCLAQGRQVEVWETLRLADEVARPTSIDAFVRCWLEDCRVRAWLAAGDLDAAARRVTASGLTVDGPLNYHYDLHHINLARVLVARGRADPAGPWLRHAEALLGRLQAAASRAGWVHEEIKIRLLQAPAADASGDTPAARQALGQALALAEHGGYVRLFVDEGEPVRRLLRGMEGAALPGRLHGYAARLMAAFAAGPGGRPAPAPPAGLVEPLSEREMDVLRLLASPMSSPEIASELVVSPNTVRTHIKNIYGKLGVHGRIEAVERARSLNLI